MHQARLWMKKLLFSVLIGISPAANLFAQEEEEKRWFMGAGITYSSNLGNPGVNVNATYRVTGDLHIGPDFSAILNEEGRENGIVVVRKELEYNLTAYYLFTVTEEIEVYPLTGINFSKETVQPKGQAAKKEWETGINLGGGVEFGFGWKTTRVFVESKYVTHLQTYDITIGMLFAL